MHTLLLQSRWLLCLLGLTTVLAAAEPTPEERAAAVAEARKLVNSLKPQAGEVVLRGGLAKASLPASLRYLNSEDAQTVLTKLWGNPKSDGTLGMIVPADFDPFSEASWAVVITFDEDGYVKDDDAATIDYTKLLQQMQTDIRDGNKEREKNGYAPLELVGWASPPRYDAVAKKLYWAKELKFGGASTNTLNYNIRMLGRRGVLVLNAVAGMDQLKIVEEATPALLKAIDFEAGHRYADFNAATDKTATYGVAALVAGGLAAKTGLLKTLWLGILAFKKFIIIGIIALAASAKKIVDWLRGRERATVDSGPTPPPSA